MQSTPPPVEDGREPLPQHTTPTWEMELLISGATVFSLLQLPELLDQALYALFPRFEAGLASVIMLPYTYVIAATYALIATFVLHLATRAYWVALVGLRSIYPEGVAWTRLRWGPAYKRALEKRFPSQAVVVERADNRASSVFGFGIGFALMLLAPLLLMVALSAVTYAIFELSGRMLSWGMVWCGVVVLFFAPFLAVLLIDRIAGARIDPDGTFGRVTARVLDRYLRSGFSSFTNYPVLLFSGRFGQYRSSAITTIAIFAVLGLVFVRILAREDVWKFDGYADLPAIAEMRGNVLNPRNYADQRGARLTLAQLPYIQSEMIADDYVRLFVPYIPERDGKAMTAICGERPAPSAADAEAPGDALLECAARIYTVTIDGNAVEALRFDLATEPALGLRGFVAMLDVTALPRGRHVLQIERVKTDASPSTDAAAEAGEKPPRPREILFWR